MNKTLVAKGICKAYKKTVVLDNLDLTIEQGKIYGLLGRNGVGKTTLLGILTAQNKQDSGTVTYGGEQVWENQDALNNLCLSREILPSSFLGTNSIPLRYYLNAASTLYPNWDAEYAKKLISDFGLTVKKAVSASSKGQLSMLTIIIALASRAPITMLDEPVAGLDIVMRDRFYKLLLEDYTQTGRTFIISTHIIDEAASVFEEIMILKNHQISDKMPADEFISEFAFISGHEDDVDRAIRGFTVLSTEQMGKRKTCAVRGNVSDFKTDLDLDILPMNLQQAFVALCGNDSEM